jgi:uncharacterized membrane-anchored protein
MQTKNLPTIDARYWAAIVAASMCGASTGDFASRYLHLGHTKGLLPLALIFGVILWLESRSKRPTELYYWLAIITLRTAATNLADLATHDLKLGYIAVEVGLAAFMILMLTFDHLRDISFESVTATNGQRLNLPKTDLSYWIVMLTAGTLGTALGDWTADELGLGTGLGSIILGAIFFIVLATSVQVGDMMKPWYWLSIVAARTVGTTLGDFIASRRGLNFGLPLSTICTSLLLIAILVLWKRRVLVAEDDEVQSVPNRSSI